MQIKLLLALTFSAFMAFNAEAIVYSNSDYECMQLVKQIDSKTLIIEDTHNLAEGFFCRTQKQHKYNCSGDEGVGSTLYCQLENKPQNTLVFFPGLQISYTGGSNTLVFRAAPIRFKKPFIFASSPITDVGFSDNCPEYADQVEQKMLTQCLQYTTDCHTVKKEFEKKTPYKMYCRPYVKVEGKPTYKY